MRIQILESAKADLAEGRTFYERQSQGLGRHFFDSLFRDIDLLEHTYGIHPKSRSKRMFRAFSKRFPFAIYYRVKGDIIEVLPSWTAENT